MILQKPADLGYSPRRIVSLVPSQTELLHYLGLDTATVGITKFCVHPYAWFNHKSRVGGTKTVDINIVNQLNPDLIIANKEENVKEQVEQLAIHYPVWVTDIRTIYDAQNMILDIGKITGKLKTALSLVSNIERSFKQISTGGQLIRTAYLIWQKPYMSIGGDTFIHHMLKSCGLINVFSDRNRYPEIHITELQNLNVQLLLLASEPFPFNQKHIDELSAMLPGCKILLVDGEMFSWYGARLKHAPAYFNTLLHNIL